MPAADPAVASTSKETLDDTKEVPAKRKRQRIEYVPLSRPMDTFGGFHPGQAEEAVRAAKAKKRRRNIGDLGTLARSVGGSADGL